MRCPEPGWGKHLGDDVVFIAGLRFPHRVAQMGSPLLSHVSPLRRELAGRLLAKGACVCVSCALEVPRFQPAG